MKLLILCILLSSNMFATIPATNMSPQQALNILARDQRRSFDRGNVPMDSFEIQFAENLDIDSAAAEVVWTFGGDYTIATRGNLIVVTSDNANDSLGNIGATHIEIVGVDNEYAEVSEILELRGTSDAITINNFRGINRVKVVATGSEAINGGNLTLTMASDSHVLAFVEASQGITHQLIFTVPDGKKAFLSNLRVSSVKTSAGTNPQVSFTLFCFDPEVPSAVKEFSSSVTSSGVLLSLATDVIDPVVDHSGIQGW